MRKQAISRLPARRNGRSLAIGKRKRHPNRAFTEAQIRNLLAAIENIRDDALIRLGLSVGLRVSEVVTIRTSEIDFDRGLIKIWDEKKDKWRRSCRRRRRWAAQKVFELATQAAAISFSHGGKDG